MKPNEIISPDHVRWVLGIESEFNFFIEEKEFIILTGTDELMEYCQENFAGWLGDATDPAEEGFAIDIHRFAYLAIEKCAAEGYAIVLNFGYKTVDIWHRPISRLKNPLTIQCTEPNLSGYQPDMLHAQLAAIAWVYDKIQEGK